MTTETTVFSIDEMTSGKPSAYEVSSQIAAIVATFQKKDKQEEFLKALAYLSRQEQEQLKLRLNSASSDLERWTIIMQTVQQIQSSRKYIDSQTELDSERRQKMKTLMFAAGALLVGGVFIYIIIKKI